MHESLRPITAVRRQSARPVQPKRSTKLRYVVGSALIAVLVISMFSFGKSTAASTDLAIQSGISNSCMDVEHDSTAQAAVVQLWGCNKSAAQNWIVSADSIKHTNNRCLAVQANAKKVGSPIILSDCNQAPGQIWLRDASGYYNPNSQLCLMAPNNKAGTQLIVASCTDLSAAAKSWHPQAAVATTCAGSKGERIACVAENEWSGWQTSTNHLALLDKYTGGTPYEAWCADFVSYIYRQAGYAFTNGSNNGWDENVAENIQNMGFSKHYVGSGYVPKAGDVAYFDYAGGHVEIVISGGKTPTFIYGNSGKNDPTTNNGDMAANTVTSDENGSVVYYLSPN